MREMTDSVLVWNRALRDQTVFLRSGDRALEAMVGFHSVAMNGGVLHSIEHFGVEELPDIAAAYCLFGLDKVADLLIEAEQFSKTGEDIGSLEVELDKRYGKAVYNDEALFQRFETYFRQNPSEFAPL